MYYEQSCWITKKCPTNSTCPESPAKSQLRGTLQMLLAGPMGKFVDRSWTCLSNPWTWPELASEHFGLKNHYWSSSKRYDIDDKHLFLVKDPTSLLQSCEFPRWFLWAAQPHSTGTSRWHLKAPRLRYFPHHRAPEKANHQLIDGGFHNHGDIPRPLDGWFHGKSHDYMDDDWGYPCFRKPPDGLSSHHL